VCWRRRMLRYRKESKQHCRVTQSARIVRNQSCLLAATSGMLSGVLLCQLVAPNLYVM
jgi:hypothetical protein